jgi:hypothetical protein
MIIKSKRSFLCVLQLKGLQSLVNLKKLPTWAKPDSDEPPPWAKGEGKENSSKQNFEVPFFVYLLASAITAIAAVSFLTS